LAPAGIDDEKWIHRSMTKNEGSDDEVYVERYSLKTRDIDPRFPKTRVMLYVSPKPKLSISANLPRLAHGHNLTRLDDPAFASVIEVLDGLISWGLTDYWQRVLTETAARPELPVPSPLVPTTRDWFISRADLYFDYRPVRVPFRAALKALLSLQPTGRLTTIRIGDETVYHRTPAARKRLEFCIYSKEDEAKKHHKHAAELARGVIRLEVRLLDSQTIRRAFRLEHRPLLRDVFDVEAVGRVLLDKLALLDVRPGLESIVTSLESLGNRLGSSAARRLWPFLELRATGMSPKAVEEALGISHDTALRWLRELRRAGLYTAAVSVEGVIEEVVEQIQSWVASCAGTTSHQVTAADTARSVGRR
jgi:hypothetical protein